MLCHICYTMLCCAKTSASIIGTFKTFCRNSEQLFNQKTLILKPVIAVLEEHPHTIVEQHQLWRRVRARLKGELMGSMAAPGSPPGALAPVQPRPHQVTLRSIQINVYVHTVHIHVHINKERHTHEHLHNTCIHIHIYTYLCVHALLS